MQLSDIHCKADVRSSNLLGSTDEKRRPEGSALLVYQAE
jgi:hypothetical protein